MRKPSQRTGTASYNRRPTFRRLSAPLWIGARRRRSAGRFHRPRLQMAEYFAWPDDWVVQVVAPTALWIGAVADEVKAMPAAAGSHALKQSVPASAVKEDVAVGHRAAVRRCHAGRAQLHGLRPATPLVSGASDYRSQQHPGGTAGLVTAGGLGVQSPVQHVPRACGVMVIWHWPDRVGRRSRCAPGRMGATTGGRYLNQELIDAGHAEPL